jgi:hypothetical protein
MQEEIRRAEQSVSITRKKMKTMSRECHQEEDKDE